VVALLMCVLTGGGLLTTGLRNGAESLSGRLGADALLVPAGYEHEAEGALLRGEPSAFWFDAELAERLMADVNIERATPQLFISSFDSEHCDAKVQFIGVDPATDFVVSPWLSESLPGGLRDGDIIIGSKITGKAGSFLTFFGRKYTVAAKLAETGIGFDTSVFVNMPTARTAFRDYIALGGQGGSTATTDAVSSIVVKVKRDVSLTEFSRGIRYGFRAENVGVVLTKTLFDSVSRGLESMITVITVIAAALFLAALGVLAILFSVTVNERRREFGVYRAMGATKIKLATLILTESALVSFTGAIVGAGLIALIYFSFDTAIGLAADMPYLKPNAEQIAFTLLTSFAVSLIAGPLASGFAAGRITNSVTSVLLRENA
jgi:putative ABC transport system permease protein